MTRRWSLPVVGETYDGLLNDMNGFHVRAEHLHAALAAAHGGPVEEGAVGGGTGMVCHEFKGGIGTASRVLAEDAGGYTVGVLVQANYGKRDWLRIDGVRVGEAIPISEVPSPYGTERRVAAAARLRLDHRRRRDRRPAAPPPVRAARPAGRARDRPGRRDRRSHERRPVHRVRDRQPAAARSGDDDDPAGLGHLRRPGRRRHRHRPPVRRGHRGDRGGDRQRARRGRRRSSAATASRPTPSPTTGCVEVMRRGRSMSRSRPGRMRGRHAARSRRSWPPTTKPVDWPDLPGSAAVPRPPRSRRHAAARGRARRRRGRRRRLGRGRRARIVRFLTDLFVDPARQEPRRRSGAAATALLDGATERMTFSLGRRPRALGAVHPGGDAAVVAVALPRGRCGTLGAHDEPASTRVRPTSAETARAGRWPGPASTGRRTSSTTRRCPRPPASPSRDDGAVAAVGWARREQAGPTVAGSTHASIAPDADPVRAAFGAPACRGRRGAVLTRPSPVRTPRSRALLERGVADRRPRHVLCHRPRPARSGPDPARTRASSVSDRRRPRRRRICGSALVGRPRPRPASRSARR